MSRVSSLELPLELKQTIERVAKERNQQPATLLALAIDSLLAAEDSQLGEVRRRDLTDPREHYTNEDAFSKLDSFRPSRRSPSPK